MRASSQADLRRGADGDVADPDLVAVVHHGLNGRGIKAKGAADAGLQGDGGDARLGGARLRG